jgi:hypothetical protein
MNSGRERFVRLAEARTNKLLKGLDLLGNLSNRSNYVYNEDDVKKIFGTLRKKLKDIEVRFEAMRSTPRNGEFKL